MSSKEKNEVVIFENQDIKLEVNMKDETVWLTQEQMANLFGKDRTVITRHISNIFSSGELEKKSNVQKMHITGSDKPVTIYNLDVIISVGYRIKSKQGIAFRKWATATLKDYLIKGFAINQKRLEYLEKTIKLIDIANRIDLNKEFEDDDAKKILKVLGDYSQAFNLLDDYDHRNIKKAKGKKDKRKIEYKNCKKIISSLHYNEESTIFAIERDRGLESIIANIYQTFSGEDIYPSIEEKAANFLYLIVKNHVFIDGNKRIAAALFIYFLNFYNLLNKNGRQIIDNNTLTALTLFIAESNSKEKEIIVDLIMNFLTTENSK